MLIASLLYARHAAKRVVEHLCECLHNLSSTQVYTRNLVCVCRSVLHFMLWRRWERTMIVPYTNEKIPSTTTASTEMQPAVRGYILVGDNTDKHVNPRDIRYELTGRCNPCTTFTLTQPRTGVTVSIQMIWSRLGRFESCHCRHFFQHLMNAWLSETTMWSLCHV